MAVSRGGWVGGPLSCLPGGLVWPCSSSLYEHNLNVLNIVDDDSVVVSLSHDYYTVYNIFIIILYYISF